MKNLTLIIVLFTLLACQKQGESSRNYSTAASADAAYAEAKESSSSEYYSDEADQEAEETAKKFTERRIIKTANYHFEVKDLETSNERIIDLIKSHSGFIAQSDQRTSTYRLTQNMTIRIPSDKFESLLDALEQESVYTNHKRVNSEDVSEEFFDIETRLKTKKEVRDRYIDILRNKAKTVEDILMAEEKIRFLQEEIEAKEGRLNYLKSRISLSTIHLEIYQQIAYRPQQVTHEKSFLQQSKDAFFSGWELTIDLLLGLLNIWPLLLILFLAIWKRHWIFSIFRRKK